MIMVKVLPKDLHVSQFIYSKRYIYICLRVFGFLKGPRSRRWKFCLGLSSAPYATADEYSSYTSETPFGETRGSLLVKDFFDKHHNSRVLLLLVVVVVVVLGISIVIGDGIPSPSISEAVFWPILLIATLATSVASQAIIPTTFSIISQFRAPRCFPRVKVIHASSQIHGQIYISEVNWILIVLCIAVVVGFRDTDIIGNTYGLPVIAVMFVTTCLMFLAIAMVWKGSVLAALAFCSYFWIFGIVHKPATRRKKEREMGRRVIKKENEGLGKYKRKAVHGNFCGAN